MRPAARTEAVSSTSVPPGIGVSPQVTRATVRRPTACVRAGDGVVTIDAGGRVLQDGCALRAAARIDAGSATVPARCRAFPI